MFIILGVLAFIAVLFIIYFIVPEYSSIKNICVGWIVSIFIFFIIFITIQSLWSYVNYLDARSFWDATCSQYSNSIEMYADRAVLKVDDKTFTDFKYKGYQDNMAGFIKDLRTKIVEYNTIIVQKKILKKSLFFNWFITAPDEDMKLLKMQ